MKKLAISVLALLAAGVMAYEANLPEPIVSTNTINSISIDKVSVDNTTGSYFVDASYKQGGVVETNGVSINMRSAARIQVTVTPAEQVAVMQSMGMTNATVETYGNIPVTSTQKEGIIKAVAFGKAIPVLKAMVK